MSSKPDLSGIQGYYRARVEDLKCFSKYGTPWEFTGGAMLIEWIANLSAPDSLSYPSPKLQRPYFVDLLTSTLPQYADFEYQTPIASIEDPSSTTKKYLPLQLYISFRNPLVHAFSMLPENRDKNYIPPENPKSYKQLDRPASIVICHRNSDSNRWDGGHLALVEGDRCQLRSPDFLEDLDDLITVTFKSADEDIDLAKRIHKRFNQRRPIDTLGELKILHEGPKS